MTKEILFAIYKNKMHVANTKAVDAKSAVDAYCASFGIKLIKDKKPYKAIKAVNGKHF